MSIRPITNDDFNIIMENMIKFHQESSFKGLDLSMVKCNEILRRCVEDEDYFGAIAEDDGVFCGIFIGYYCPYYFGDDLLARDLLLYVPLDKRNGRSAIRLVRSFENWARIKGCKNVQVGVSTGIDDDRIVAFYQKIGYSYKGTLLQKEP